MRLPSVLLLTLALASTARAEITVTLQPGPGADYAARFGLNTAELEAQIRAQIQNAFNEVNPGAYLKALADAHAFSTKGLGVDYASNITTAVFGFGVNVAVAFDESTLTTDFENQRPIGGLAPNLAIMAGMNMKPLGIPALTVFAHGFMRKERIDQLDAELRNFGVHGQIKLMRPKDEGGVELAVMWGGLDLTVGLTYSYLGLGISQQIQTNMNVQAMDGGPDGTIEMTSNGQFNISSTAYLVSADLTTNVRLAYFVTLYGGIGFDVQMGGSDMDINLTGQMTGVDPQNGERLNIGTANVRVTESAAPTPGKIRFLAGVQANLWKIRIFAQANYLPLRAVAVAAGLRVAW